MAEPVGSDRDSRSPQSEPVAADAPVSPSPADGFRDARRFRLRLALAMAAISLVSAYVSYVAGERDATADDLNALASQQWAEEQQVEQQIDAQIAQDQQITARIDEYLTTYRESLAEADQVRSEDPERAAELDLQAQAAWAQYEQLAPFLRVMRPELVTEVATYDADAARSLARFWDWRLFRESSDRTSAEAADASDVAAATVLVVVMLVTSLLLLTLAHISGGRRGIVLAAVGIAIALVGVVLFVALDARSALPLLVGTVLLAVVLAATRIPQVRTWLAGIEHDRALDLMSPVSTRPGTTAVANPNDPPSAGFDRYVAIAIAVATLLGAGVGYLHARTSSSSEAEAWTARDLGVEGIGALRAAEESLAVRLETYQQALVNRVGAWDAVQRQSYSISIGDTGGAEEWAREAARLERLAVRHEDRSELGDDLGVDGVTGQAELRGLWADVWLGPAELSAQQDASNAASRVLGARAGVYLSVLAWLAVAAYLLGLSLVFRDRRVRAVLASVGTLLILAGMVRTSLVWIEPDPIAGPRADAAAEAYAAGFVAMMHDDSVRAEEYFSDAVDARPDFGMASRERAQAFLASGSAPGLGIRAAFTEDAVNQAIVELERARANHADSAGVMLNLGAMLYHRSIHTGSMADMEQSLAHTRKGLALGRTYEDTHGSPHVNQLIGEMNLGLALLGTGDVDGASRAYESVGARIAEVNPAIRQYLITSALTPLDLLRDGPDPLPDDVIADMKEIVVSAGYGVGGASTAEVTSTRVEVFPSLLQWRATIAAFDEARDDLTVHWYRFDETVGAWNGLPVMSGQLVLGAPNAVGQFWPDVASGEGAFWGNSGTAALSDVPPSCVRAGRYRVELYLNGRLKGVGEAGSTQEETQPLLAHDVGAALCHPQGWSTSARPGLSVSATSPDGAHGVAVFRIHQPRGPAGSDIRPIAIDRALRSGLEVLPEGLDIGIPLDPLTQPTVLNRRDSAWRQFAYPGGIARVSATDRGAGTITVVCLFGSEAWMSSPEAVSLVLSVTHY